jgi:hypothetical protein
MPSMFGEDTQPEEGQVQVIATPLCDDEEPADQPIEPEHVDSSDGDVEAHGGSGFTDHA